MFRTLIFTGAFSMIAVSAAGQVSPSSLSQGIGTYDISVYDPIAGGSGTPFPYPQSNVPMPGPGGFDISYGAGTLSYADIYVNNSPYSMTATTQLAPGGGSGPFTSSTEFASGNVTFEFAVSGNNPATIVSVNLFAVLSAQGAIDPATGYDSALGIGGVLASADLTILDTSKPVGAPFSDPYYYDFSTGQTFVYSVNLVAGPINLVEDDIYYVEETVGLQGGVFGYGSAIQAAAHADPTFSLAHGQPGVSLVISPGLNSLIQSSAPEAGAWALMIAGIGVMGAGLRKQQRRRA